MSELITNASGIEATEKKEITLSAERNEDLLVRWLNELIYLFDTYSYVGRAFHAEISKNILTAHVSGGIFDDSINESRLLIKAATYHRLSLKKNKGSWEGVAIFDI